MKTPRVDYFDPNAQERKLKSSLEGMPPIEKPKPKGDEAATPVHHQQVEKPPAVKQGVPPAVPLPVPPRVPLPLVPKVKRPIRQRQPFDIYEDQYERLKKIAEEEKGFMNGRGMSQMVREAIDNYLKDNSSK